MHKISYAHICTPQVQKNSPTHTNHTKVYRIIDNTHAIYHIHYTSHYTAYQHIPQQQVVDD